MYFVGENKETTKRNTSSITYGLLQVWNPSISEPDMVVAQDGSGSYKTINEAMTALKRRNRNGNKRIVIYVKSGVYREYVEIGSNMRKLFFVGDGVDKTIVTGNRMFQMATLPLDLPPLVKAYKYGIYMLISHPTCLAIMLRYICLSTY